VPLGASEIRETFLRFFEARGHRVLPSSSLVPEGDPTLLFTNAGMVPFKRVFQGEEARPYTRAVTSQKCLRVSGKHNDLENVGRTPRHLTFFEMLGNFSFGDYFKRDAVAWAWELVTRVWGLPPEKLGVTVFREDDEAERVWREEVGVAADRILRLDEADNFWQMGEIGPCGPCSEIYFDTGPRPGSRPGFDPTDESGRWFEIWNLVFMQFNRDASGAMTPLPRPCVDTGAGLERVAAVLQGVSRVYDTDLFRPVLARAQEISGVARGADPETDVSLHVIADHARALAFLIGDGVLPSNEGRGYVLRRLLRRAARHGALLGIERPFLHRVADAVIDTMAGAYPELAERRAFVTGRIEREEARFLETLAKGLALLEEEMERLRRAGGRTLPGAAVFRLYDTFGFPVDLTEDVLRGHGLALDQAGFEQAMQAQRERARAAWKGSGETRVDEVYARLAGELATAFHGYETLRFASTVRALLVEGEPREAARAGEAVEIVVDETPFYAEAGGQVGDRGEIHVGGGRALILDTQRPAGDLAVHRGRVAEGEIRVGDAAELRVDAAARAATVRNHSGTHLLHAALRKVLGPQALQKGSLVAPDRLRFDFTHDSPLSRAEIAAIEDLVNAWIEADAQAQVRQMSYADAIAAGAVAIFEEKYGEQVRVISFGDFSTELCGGTHARATGEIGLLRILSESGIAAGVRRIEALTGLGALDWVRGREELLERAAGLLRVPSAELPERIERLLEERRALEREVAALRAAARGAASRDLTQAAREVGGVRVVAARVDGADPQSLRGMVDDLRKRLGSGIVLLASEHEGRIAVALGVTPDLTSRFRAGDLVREVCGVLGGKGGGRPDFAQGGGADPSRLEAAFRRLDALIEEA
jgi:alanyl-tRNA synthetase